MPGLTAPQLHTPVVVVAGGAGFLGSHLCESLLSSGATVLALDDLVTGSLANIEPFKQHPHFEFFECNINRELPAALFERGVTHVVHAAGIGTHAKDQVATLAEVLTGAYGTKNLLDLAVKTGSRFLLLSSTHVYEGLASSTSLEYYYGSSSQKEAEYSMYEARRYAEGLCQLYATEYQLDTRVARLAQVYGPRMNLQSEALLNQLVRQAVRGEDLAVEADGGLELSLVYVSDAVYGISRLLFADEPQFKETIYPLANPEKVSVISVAYTLRDYLPTGKEVKFLSQNQVPAFELPKVALERSEQDLGWQPEVVVSVGMKQTMEWFKAHPPEMDHPVADEDDVQTLASVANKIDSAEAVRPVGPSLKYRGNEGVARVVASAHQPTPEAVNQSEVVVVAPKPKVHRNRVKKPKAIWWKRLLLGATAVLLYVSVGRPLVQATVYGGAAVLTTEAGVSQVKGLDLAEGKASFDQAAAESRRAVGAMASFGWLSMVGQKQFVAEGQQSFLGLAAVDDGLATLVEAGQPLLSEVGDLAKIGQAKPNPQFGQTIQASSQTLAQAQAQLFQAQEILALEPNSRVAGIQIKGNQEVSLSSSWWDGWLMGLRGQVSQLLSGLDQAQQVLTVLPTALGGNGAKSYLVMLQNGNELRPMGGFMGSYALVKVDGGRITELKVDDIYNPDGQLQSKVPAPAALTAAFNESTLPLRDANWWPDGPTSAQQVASLYTQATGQAVDGVFFVDTSVMHQILTAVGPVHLDAYNQTVTAENMDELAEQHSDVGFVPGSTAKKDFLGVLAQAVLSKVESETSAEVAVGKSLEWGAGHQELFGWTADPAVMVLLDEAGWSGRMAETNADYLRVVEANVGSNKANYYVTRSTSYAVNVDRDQGLHGVLRVAWKHSGPSATWPDGDYQAYVRVYVPLGSVLTSTDGFVGKVTTDQELGKTVFGGMIDVHYNSKASVELRYDLPSRLALTVQQGKYELDWQKQSGILNEPLQVAFNAPSFLQTTAISGGGQLASDGSVAWSSRSDANQAFSLSLGQ